ncbi:MULTISPECIES: hypothetical protein [unclassified Chryseobacterium]|uniref:hypothetical protein n=1 Tax=unclassified Chryseobacterium TaxID=2593645 RepID=UPI001E5DDC58|nr:MULTISPECIES: hypothetical protein [unclassified Chryseobacterium]MCD0456001.1 hypothetical protein [Chryseobacterium sp. LC2016-27]
MKVQAKVTEPEQVSPPIAKASKPLSKPNISSGFSINSFMSKEEKTDEKEKTVIVNTGDLPEHHFTDTDIQTEWTILLKTLRSKDPVVFNAIKAFKLAKIDEKIIEISYPSDSAKSEFDKISIEFFNHFKHKVNNHSIIFEFKKDHENLKIEIMTTKKIFEKFVEMNPLLKELDDLMRFDLS